MAKVIKLLVPVSKDADALTRASSSAMKSYLTRREDRFRPPYGKRLINRPRQNVFAGSINPPFGGYLKDPTGARRFWPVACRGMIDCDGLKRIRDQLWAEAVERYKARAPWWLETIELEALAAKEQAARFVSDPWEKTISDWLGDRHDVSVKEVIENALSLALHQQTQSAMNRVAKILTKLHFGKHRPRTTDGRENRYWRDPPLQKAGPGK